MSRWINSLPQIDYNFKTEEVTITKYPITYILEKVMLGKGCMGFAGDYVVKTAYYLIIRIFELNQPGSFDTFMTNMFPYVLDLERQVVNYQLSRIQNADINEAVQLRVRILTERREELNKPIPLQPIFEPTLVKANIHV